MTIKPFAIQGADLTLGGINLQAGTTGVVIPGVTQATNSKVEEVNDTGDQTLWFATPPIIIDFATFYTWQTYGNANGNTFATYEATLDGEGYIDQIDVTDAGAYSPTLVNMNQGNDMYIYSGNAADPFGPFVYTDWTQIPFRPKMRAGEIETIGGGGGGSLQRADIVSTIGFPIVDWNVNSDPPNVVVTGDATNAIDSEYGGWGYISYYANGIVLTVTNSSYDSNSNATTIELDSLDDTSYSGAVFYPVFRLTNFSTITGASGALEIANGKLFVTGSSGNSGTNIEYREVLWPTGAVGDTAGTIAIDGRGRAYICMADYNDSSTQSYSVFENSSFDIGQTGGTYMVLTVSDNNSDGQDVLNLWANHESAIPTGWTISGPNVAGTYVAHEIGTWPANSGDQSGLKYIKWLHWPNDPTTINDATEFTLTYTPANREIWIPITQATALISVNGGSVEILQDPTQPSRYNIVVDAEKDVVILTDEASNEFRFTHDGGLKFPDGSTQTTAYTGQATGGTGELYVMANVDGNIITSTDGITWGEPVACGVPTFGGGPFPVAIGKLEVHGGVIVYTRTDEGNSDGIRGSGLYYSTEIGTATLCVGTDADPGAELFWNEVHFFHETDMWVAVGYSQYGGPFGDSRKPIYAYSTTGISWTVSYVDPTFVSDHNSGNWSWEMTDVAYNTADSVYVFVGKVGGSNHAGAFVTNNLPAGLDGTNWVDINMNARAIVSIPGAPSFGPPVTGLMIAVSSEVSDVWSCYSPVSDSNNWYQDYDAPGIGWYQGSMIDAVGYVPDIAEVASNGSSMIITTADGQVAIPTFGPSNMNVTVPLVYTSTINDIYNNDWTINAFTVSPIVGGQNPNWSTFSGVVNSGDDSFTVEIDGTGTLVTCSLFASGNNHAVGDTITFYGATFGGTTGVDDLVVTVTALSVPLTYITFTGNSIANDGGEKITISGVTSHSAPGTTEQSYNGSRYIKKFAGAGGLGEDIYGLFTDQACTIPWNTHDYWPHDQYSGTITWSHGQFLDAAGCSNSYYFIGNDNEQIFRSTDAGVTWVQEIDSTGAYLNDFAYGTWGGGASSSGTVTIESPFVVDFFGPEVYFVKTNYGSEVDNIDTGLSITRGNDQGIYNPVQEGGWNGNGPTYTEWNMDGWADLSNVKNRYYTSWSDVCNGGANTLYREFVMHDTNNDKYYAIMFHSFQGGGGYETMGGGFSYSRRLINTDCWFNRDDGDSSGYGDHIATGITLVRDSDGGIYNSDDEGNWSDNYSPTGTGWNADGWDDLTNVTTRQYLNLRSMAKGAIGKEICGLELVMKDTIHNTYYAIKFSYWGHGGNGGGGSYPGYRYTRRQIDLTKVSHNVKFADGSIQTTAVTEQRLGVLPQKLVDNNQDRYLTLDDVGKHLFVTAGGTNIIVTDSVKYEFPVGSVITIINKSGSNIYINKDDDDENGTIYGANQNSSSDSWIMSDTGSGNMVTLIKFAQYYDGNPYADWMIAGSGITPN